MKDIVLVYRENDLFEQLVPAVVNVLSGFGCSVKTIEFDRSTTRQSVKKNLSIEYLNLRTCHSLLMKLVFFHSKALMRI